MSQLTLFDDLPVVNGCQITIPGITLEPNENQYPEDFMMSYNGEPICHITITQSPTPDEFDVSFRTIGKRTGLIGYDGTGGQSSINREIEMELDSRSLRRKA